MIMRPGEREAYGYRLRSYINGEVIADRRFQTREEMEAGLVEDLAPDKLIGSIFKDTVGGDTTKA